MMGISNRKSGTVPLQPDSTSQAYIFAPVEDHWEGQQINVYQNLPFILHTTLLDRSPVPGPTWLILGGLFLKLLLADLVGCLSAPNATADRMRCRPGHNSLQFRPSMLHEGRESGENTLNG